MKAFIHNDFVYTFEYRKYFSHLILKLNGNDYYDVINAYY